LNGFLFALLAVQLAGIGARDQILVAQMTAKQGLRPALLIIALLTSTIAAILAGWAAAEAPLELGRSPRLAFAALALGLGGIESLLFSKPKPPKEPTQSLAAAAIVLFAQQITDSGRLLIFAIAVATNSSLAVLGGVLGGAASLVIGWLGGAQLLGNVGMLRLARFVSGALLLGTAIGLMLVVLGDIDNLGPVLATLRDNLGRKLDGM
jgi:putative Ca2+/H+ antiporter (TMEM165/GDT1 family)